MYEYLLSTIHKGVVETWLSNKDNPTATLFVKFILSIGIFNINQISFV